MSNALKITTCKYAYIYDMGVQINQCQWADGNVLPPVIKETSIRGISESDCERCKCWKPKS